MLDDEYPELRRGKRLVVKLRRCRLNVDSTTLMQPKEKMQPGQEKSGTLSDSLDVICGLPKCKTSVGTESCTNRDTDMRSCEVSFEMLDTDILDVCESSSETRRKRERLDAIVKRLHQRVNGQLLTNQATFGDESPFPLHQTPNDRVAESTNDCSTRLVVPTSNQSPVVNRVAQPSNKQAPRSRAGKTVTSKVDEKVTTSLHPTQAHHSKKETWRNDTGTLTSFRVNEGVPDISTDVQCMTSFRNYSLPGARALRPAHNSPSRKRIINFNARQQNYLLSNQNGFFFSVDNVPFIDSNMNTWSTVCAPTGVTNFSDLSQPQRSILPLPTWIPYTYQSNLIPLYPTSDTNVIIPSIMQRCVLSNTNFNASVPPNMYYSF